MASAEQSAEEFVRPTRPSFEHDTQMGSTRRLWRRIPAAILPACHANMMVVESEVSRAFGLLAQRTTLGMSASARGQGPTIVVLTS